MITVYISFEGKYTLPQNCSKAKYLLLMFKNHTSHVKYEQNPLISSTKLLFIIGKAILEWVSSHCDQWHVQLQVRKGI